MKKKLLLIDGHSIINRAFYGLPDLTNAEGRHTGAVYGFLTILYRFIEEEKPDALAVAFDVHAPTFRHEIYPEYKGKRKPMPTELKEQVPLLKEVLDAMGVMRMEQAGLEADDLLGTAAKRSEAAGWCVTIVSGDRDLLQVATKDIIIAQPKTVRGTTTVERFDADAVETAWGVSGERFIDLKALMGDSSDNIPGLPKVGEKTAKELMAQFGSGEAIFARADEITKKGLRETVQNNRPAYDLSRTLSVINQDAPFVFEIDRALIPDGDAGRYFNPAACDLCRRLGFVKLLNKYAAQTGTDSSASAIPVDDRPAGDEWTEVSEDPFADDRQADHSNPFYFGYSADSKDQQHQVVICRSASEADDAFAELAGEDTVIGVCALYDASSEGKKLFGVGTAWQSPAQGIRQVFLEPGEMFTSSQIGDTLTALSSTHRIVFYGAADAYRLFRPAGDASDMQLAVYLLNPLNSEPSAVDAATFLGIPAACRTWAEQHGKEAYAAHPEDAVKTAVALAKFAAAYIPAADDRLEKCGMKPLMYEVEMPLSYILYDMERLGIRVKKDALKTYGDELSGRITQLEELIHSAAGEDFNINSPKQLGEILFEKMHLPGGKKTKTGYSTAADVLEKLAPEAPIIRDILEYRGLAKLKSTYADGLAAFIGPDGRIHGRFHQMVTATGRISSSDPNLQNIPMRTELGRAIRRVFVPEEGFVFADADYSQIELRILAAMSGDADLIEAYKEGRDIHAITASRVFGVPLDQVTPIMRRNAKAVNFGIVYGISSFGLSQNIDISRAEAADYIKQYFATYPAVKRFLDGLVKSAKDKGYAETLFGRRRPIPELSSSNFMQRGFGERVAMNAPIQGTAADIMKIAMIRVFNRLKDEGLKSRLILQIHDELLIETALGEEEAVRQILTQEMTGAADLAVPLTVDLHFGSDWFEAK